MPTVKVDFTDVQDGFKLPAEGPQICKVKSITLEEGNKGKYLKWTLVIGTGPDKGSQIFHNTSFVPAALFNLRDTLIACGQEVPKAAFNLNTDTCIGKVVGIDVVHSEYVKDGAKKTSAKVASIYRVAKTDSGWVKVNDNGAAVIETKKPPVVDELEEEEEIDI